MGSVVVILQIQFGGHGEDGSRDGVEIIGGEIQRRGVEAEACEIEKGGGKRVMAPSCRVEAKGGHMVPAERTSGYANVLCRREMEMPPPFPIDGQMIVVVVAALRFWIFGVEIDGQALVVFLG